MVKVGRGRWRRLVNNRRERNVFPMGKERGFTLVELAIAVFILLLILLLAVPSLRGVMADRELRRSFEAFTALASQAQELSMTERRPYLLIWEKGAIVLRPEVFAPGEEEAATAVLTTGRGDAYTLNLPAALSEKPAPEWIFWPSGTCEPALVGYKGSPGSWTAYFSPLTGRADLTNYAAN